VTTLTLLLLIVGLVPVHTPYSHWNKVQLCNEFDAFCINGHFEF
jgi:hypothetical protein